MLLTEIPNCLAFDTIVPHVECEAYLFVSIPAYLRMPMVHWQVSLEMALCGLIKLTSSWHDLLISLVLDIYAIMADTTQMFIIRKRSKLYCGQWVPGTTELDKCFQIECSIVPINFKAIQ